jgi:hypothetical protein
MTAIAAIKRQPLSACEACKFFLPDTLDYTDQVTKHFGICRRYPPSAIGYSSEGEHIETALRPMVATTDWCGCFSRLTDEV